MYMEYTYDELEKVLFSSKDTNLRDRVFLELFEKAKKNDLTYIESKFFCTFLNHTYKNFGTQTDCEVCEEYIFNSLYKTFYKDLGGTSQIINKWGNIISDKEKKEGLEKLNSFFLDWEKTIFSNSKDNLIKEIKRETKREIKLFKKKDY